MLVTYSLEWVIQSELLYTVFANSASCGMLNVYYCAGRMLLCHEKFCNLHTKFETESKKCYHVWKCVTSCDYIRGCEATRGWLRLPFSFLLSLLFGGLFPARRASSFSSPRSRSLLIPQGSSRRRLFLSTKPASACAHHAKSINSCNPLRVSSGLSFLTLLLHSHLTYLACAPTLLYDSSLIFCFSHVTHHAGLSRYRAGRR